MTITKREVAREPAVIARRPCDTCDGTGSIPEYEWPKECQAACALTLRSYWSGGQYWLCGKHFVAAIVPVLWSPEQKARALKALTDAAILPQRRARRVVGV